MSSDKTLATFRIEADKWERFKDKAGNASKVLTEFIDAYLAGLIDTASWEALTSPEKADESVLARLDSLDSDIDSRIESAIASLRSEFAPALNAHREVEVLLGK
jgi:hypothetical protein